MNKNIFALVLLFSTTTMFARSDCDDKVFSSLTASKGTTISQMLDQLSYKCSFSIVAKDDVAEKTLNDKQLNTVNLRDFTLKEIFDFLLTENELDYEYQNNILKVSSYTTKTFKVDYITAIRSADTKFSMGAGASGGTSSASGSSSTVGQLASTSLGSTFRAEDKDVSFWKSIENDLMAILNPNINVMQNIARTTSESQRKGDILSGSASATSERVESTNIKSNSLIINPQAGLITITAPKIKLEKAEKYIETTMERLHQQVFIDVQILSVALNKTHTTGIDWGKVYKAAGITASYGSAAFKGSMTIDSSTGVITEATSGGSGGLAQYFRVNGGVDLTDFIKFLKTQGDVKTVSNPKVMTLNNQPALITSGDVIFYPKVSG
ncbi:MAG: secretin and TonB N-terminal domain-containing protein [Campylobacterales bacterium]|nr:secretin and TonB N-terminal domain-containing protein [Campylobacterales bacterium]